MQMFMHTFVNSGCNEFTSSHETRLPCVISDGNNEELASFLLSCHSD